MSVSRIAVTTVAAVLLAVPAAAQTTSLASLQLDPADGSAGTRVRVTGTWFAAAGDDRYSSVSPAELRWGGSDGPVVAVVRPDEGGTFITSITVPPAAAQGHHLLVAVQTVVSRDGLPGPAPGTPARAVFTVGSLPADAPAVGAPATRASGVPPIVLTGLATAAGLALFSGAGVLLARELSRPRPLRTLVPGQQQAAGAAWRPEAVDAARQSTPPRTIHAPQDHPRPPRTGGDRR